MEVKQYKTSSSELAPNYVNETLPVVRKMKNQLKHFIPKQVNIWTIGHRFFMHFRNQGLIEKVCRDIDIAKVLTQFSFLQFLKDSVYLLLQDI